LLDWPEITIRHDRKSGSVRPDREPNRATGRVAGVVVGSGGQTSVIGSQPVDPIAVRFVFSLLKYPTTGASLEETRPDG
jgi:hypothetical protein